MTDVICVSKAFSSWALCTCCWLLLLPPVFCPPLGVSAHRAQHAQDQHSPWRQVSSQSAHTAAGSSSRVSAVGRALLQLKPTSSSSTGRTQERSSSSSSSSSSKQAAKDWIGELTQPTSVIASPIDQQQLPSLRSDGVAVLFDGRRSQAEKGHRITRFMWVITAIPGGRSSSSFQSRGQTGTTRPGSVSAAGARERAAAPSPSSSTSSAQRVQLQGPLLKRQLPPGVYSCSLVVVSDKGQSSTDEVMFVVLPPGVRPSSVTAPPRQRSSRGDGATPRGSSSSSSSLQPGGQAKAGNRPGSSSSSSSSSTIGSSEGGSSSAANSKGTAAGGRAAAASSTAGRESGGGGSVPAAATPAGVAMIGAAGVLPLSATAAAAAGAGGLMPVANPAAAAGAAAVPGAPVPAVPVGPAATAAVLPNGAAVVRPSAPAAAGGVTATAGGVSGPAAGVVAGGVSTVQLAAGGTAAAAATPGGAAAAAAAGGGTGAVPNGLIPLPAGGGGGGYTVSGGGGGGLPTVSVQPGGVWPGNVGGGSSSNTTAPAAPAPSPSPKVSLPPMKVPNFRVTDQGNSLTLTPLVINGYCNPGGVPYDPVNNPDDYDILSQCCAYAVSLKITDSECNNLPAQRPGDNGDDDSLPPDESQPGIVQQCIPSQFDFSVPFQQQLWLDCCDNVLQEAKRDLACEKDQW